MNVQKLSSYVWVVPVLVTITGLVLLPLLWTVWMSFQQKTVGGQAVFIGLQNFHTILSSGVFFSSFLKSLTYTIPAIALKLILGMALAIILNKPFRGRNLLRVWFFIPWTIPRFAVAIIFLWLLTYSGGMNLFLSKLGLSPVFWLGPERALAAVTAINVWKGYPFFMVGILAGLQVIPDELYEAAAIDGASGFQSFFYVTLPGLKDAILIISALSTIWTFAEFDIVYLLTGGGPGDATNILPVLTYLTAFRKYNMGQASALAMLALPVYLLLIFGLVKMIRKGKL